MKNTNTPNSATRATMNSNATTPATVDATPKTDATKSNPAAELFKEFYNAEKGAPAFLHNFGGLDFCAPYVLRKFNTPTTYRAIFDALSIPHTGDGWQVFAFFPAQYGQHLRAVKIENINYFSIDLDPYRYTDNAPDDFYRKADAEQARKARGVVWIVAQKDEHTTTPRGEKFNRIKIDTRERYNLRSVDTYRTQTGARGVSRVLLTDRKTGAAVCYDLNKYPRRLNDHTDPDDLPAVIDKSGYITHQQRATLKRRAETLRAERKKAQADATDTTATAQELRDIAEKVKADAARIFATITTAQSIKEFCNVCGGWWSGLAGLFYDVEKFTEKATAKTFTSPEEIAKKAQSIKDNAREISEKLNALTVAEV